MADVWFSRRRLLGHALGVGALGLWGCKVTTPPKTARMPVLFVGHGSPMNAIEENRWSQGFRELGLGLPRPKAVVSISAHWFTPGTFVTGNARPPTIHDFGGFPQALFDMEYAAPGSPELARQLVNLLTPKRAAVREDWGLDHGSWTVLHHLLPKADVPVVQLSIDGRLPPSEHLALAKALSGLRDEGVLVMGSGNVTHNLRHAFSSFQNGDLSTPSWAQRFDDEVVQAFDHHDGARLCKLAQTDEGRLSHPTPDHFLPMVYALGASSDQDKVRYPLSGFDLGSLSMRSILLS